ncbi:unnamed protein product, partial [Didymodactylos carnosus]
MVTGASAFGIATLGIGAVISGAASEVAFRKKLVELIETLQRDVANVQSQKNERLQHLNSYFDRFEQSLRQQSNPNAQVNLIWYDENIQNPENQSFATRLEQEFPSNQYCVVQFHNRALAIDFIESNVDHKMILITSGSTGETVIADIGYYWNIKGIIIYCMQVEQHRLWINSYTRIVLVTSNSNAVVQKIRDIELGNIYFINAGCSFRDITLKLENAAYYLSTNEQGFIISNLRYIHTDANYHRSVMDQFHRTILSKNLYPDGIPSYFKLNNLHLLADEFAQALLHAEPVNQIINLYTAQAPYYYKIINTILNRLDEDLISLMADYIKALRYALL